jgi:hypothetical protein
LAGAREWDHSIPNLLTVKNFREFLSAKRARDRRSPATIREGLRTGSSAGEGSNGKCTVTEPQAG